MTDSPEPTVLLVEDSEDDALLLKRAWRKAGIDLPMHHAEDGQQAIEFLSGKNSGEPVKPSCLRLVLLDLKLPIIHGFEVLAWVRARREFDAVCIVILSSSPEPTDVDRAYALGANCYLTKAVSVETLRELAEKLPNAKPRAVLELRRAERAQGSRRALTAGERF